MILPLLLALELLKFPTTLDDNPEVAIRINNAEATRDHRSLLVHVFLKPRRGKVREMHWEDLCFVLNAAGEELRCSPDCGVDTGTGMHITMGPYPLAERGETRMLLYFNLAPSDFPVRLKLSDGRVSGPIR